MSQQKVWREREKLRMQFKGIYKDPLGPKSTTAVNCTQSLPGEKHTNINFQTSSNHSGAMQVLG